MNYIYNIFNEYFEFLLNVELFTYLQISGITVFGLLAWVVGLFKKQRSLGRSNFDLAIENKEKSDVIFEYEKLMSKANSELELFNSFIPATENGQHMLYHELDIARHFANEIQERVISDVDHVNYSKEESVILPFLDKFSCFIAREYLVAGDEYTCARIGTSYQIFNDYLENLMVEEESRCKIWKHEISFEKIIRDLNVLDFVERINEASDSKRVLDYVISTKYLLHIYGDDYIADEKSNQILKQVTESVYKNFKLDCWDANNFDYLVMFVPNFIGLIIFISFDSEEAISSVRADLKNKLFDSSANLNETLADFLKDQFYN